MTAIMPSPDEAVIDPVRRPCACSFDGGWPRFTADWHRRHRDQHLTEFPDVDQITRDNLAMFIERAEEQQV